MAYIQSPGFLIIYLPRCDNMGIIVTVWVLRLVPNMLDNRWTCICVDLTFDVDSQRR